MLHKIDSVNDLSDKVHKMMLINVEDKKKNLLF